MKFLIKLVIRNSSLVIFRGATLTLFLAGFALAPLLEPASVSATTYGSGVYGNCIYGGTNIGNNSLTFNVPQTTVTLGPGPLSTAAARTGTATFSASVDCTEQGYIVVSQGSTLTSGAYSIANMGSPAASQTGIEQYGFNLKANTSPTSFGSEPSGGIGVAASGYNTANSFKFVSGDTVASTPRNSVTTTYTIAYIANIKATTPAGNYTTTHTLICVTTY